MPFDHLISRLLGRDSTKLPQLPAIPSGTSALLDAYISDALRQEQFWKLDLHAIAAATPILSAPPDEQIALALAAMNRMARALSQFHQLRTLSSKDMDWRESLALKPLLSALLRRNLPFDAPSLVFLLSCAASAFHYPHEGSMAGLVQAAEHFVQKQGLTPEVESALRELQKSKALEGDTKEQRRLRDRIAALMRPEAVQVVVLGDEDPWSKRAHDDISALDSGARAAWFQLLAHAKTATTSRPSRKWLEQARRLIQSIGDTTFVDHITCWFALVGTAGKSRLTAMGQPDATLLSDDSADFLKGLTWACAALDSPALVRQVADVAEICFKKVPGHGPRNARVGNAAVAALGLMSSPDAVAQLGRIRSRSKHPTAVRALEKTLARTSDRMGLTPDQLEDLAVPTLGLNSNGKLSRTLGRFRAELSIIGVHETQLTWKRDDGKTQKTVPSEIKNSHPDDLKELKRIEKDLRTLLPAQRDRLERTLRDPRDWSVPDWRKCCLDHPLVSVLARRLIWTVMDGSKSIQFLCMGGRFVGVDGAALGDFPESARIRLWHPIDSPAETVLAWRRLLEEHGITQPFKQAHREIYILTDAELQSGTYSNRFAAHIIRQHQFAALCQARGWGYRLMGNFDSHNTPSLPLPRHDLIAEFWIDERFDGAAVSPAGIFMEIVTDQLRFVGADRQPRDLRTIAPTLFSEVLRDADLFVGVCSIGNDPNWRDPGERPGNYWQSYAFGTLSETAKTRKSVLERLLPRLKIAGHCSFSDKFLLVKGNLRTYKIHLGSANIMMEPNDHYLCIVPSRDPAVRGDIFLPFEGDTTLAIILSKAFLLAADDKITDPTILTQIRTH